MSDLIDREAVKLAKVPYDELLSEYERGWNDACEAIADNAPAAPRWVRCEDRLPPDGEVVWCAIYSTDLIFQNDGETLEEAADRANREAAENPRCDLGVYYKGEGWSECCYGAPMVCAPKYWCYLPEPPREDE